MFTIPRSSLQNTLRWSRRVTVVILIIANLATVMLAGAARLNRIHNHNSPSIGPHSTTPGFQKRGTNKD